MGIPEPAVHDEFSYLLGADTFARGRLMNPPLAHPEFFEAPHILVTPSYASKYPPGQAAFLALGQTLTGHPISGVWIGCGVFAGSLYWMLSAWSGRRWASAVTLLTIATLGTSTYWAQSYWGGMVAAAASALVFGGLRRILRRPRIPAAAAMGLGAVLLANSRPYEGVFVCIVPAILLGRWLLTGNDNAAADTRAKFRRAVVPLSLVILGGFMWMAMYNWHVTRAIGRLPYAVHSEQYLRSGFFIFSNVRTPKRQPTDRVDAFYLKYEAQPVAGAAIAERVVTNFVARLFASLATPLGIVRGRGDVPYPGAMLWLALLAAAWGASSIRAGFLIGAAAVAFEGVLWLYHQDLYLPAMAFLMNLTWLTAFIVSSRGSRWDRVLGAAIVLVVSGESIVLWWWSHYSAPAVPPVLAIVAMTARRISRGSRATHGRRRLGRFVALLLVIHFGALALSKDFADRGKEFGYESEHSRRGDVRSALEKRGGRHLVFVRYDEGFTVEDEWVYNPADLTDAEVIFAHDLGDAKNLVLLRALAGRQAWIVAVSRSGVQLTPYHTKGLLPGGDENQ